jgi:putative membrane protein
VAVIALDLDPQTTYRACMRRPPSTALVAIAFGLGLAGLVALTAWQGLHTIVEILGQVGVRVLWLGPLWVGPLIAAAVSWRLMFPHRAPSFTRLLLARWVGFSVNQLLPVARVGGELVRGRLAITGSVRPATVFAAVVADKTALVGSIVVYALLGLGLLMGARWDPGATGAAAAGVLLLAGGGAAFYVTQRRGLIPTVGGWLQTALPQGHAQTGALRVQEGLERVYDAPWRLVAGVLFHTLFRVGLSVEVYLALAWIGQPVPFWQAVVLESLTQVIRAAAFMVPGALGAQEGAFVLLGALFQIPAPVALSVSLCKRAREICVGVPGLVAWQAWEGRGLLQVLRGRSPIARSTAPSPLAAGSEPPAGGSDGDSSDSRQWSTDTT